MQSCGCPTLWLCHDATVPQKLKKERNGFYTQGDISPSGERDEPVLIPPRPPHQGILPEVRVYLHGNVPKIALFSLAKELAMLQVP